MHHQFLDLIQLQEKILQHRLNLPIPQYFQLCLLLHYYRAQIIQHHHRRLHLCQLVSYRTPFFVRHRHRLHYRRLHQSGRHLRRRLFLNILQHLRRLMRKNQTTCRCRPVHRLHRHHMCLMGRRRLLRCGRNILNRH